MVELGSLECASTIGDAQDLLEKEICEDDRMNFLSRPGKLIDLAPWLRKNEAWCAINF